jgi:hypothetical protein
VAINHRGNNSCKIASLFRPPLIHFREYCKIILLALKDLRKAGRNSGPGAEIRTVTSTELFQRMALSLHFPPHAGRQFAKLIREGKLLAAVDLEQLMISAKFKDFRPGKFTRDD